MDEQTCHRFCACVTPFMTYECDTCGALLCHDCGGSYTEVQLLTLRYAVVIEAKNALR